MKNKDDNKGKTESSLKWQDRKITKEVYIGFFFTKG
jgi:hypothetical protein